MTATLKIARRELRSLFFSPIAWVLLIIFVVQVSIDYGAMLGNMSRAVLRGIEQPLTNVIFALPTFGVLDQLVTALMFYVPLLTMGLISRERQNGSIKLLMSAPVTLAQVVLGKYLAMMAFLLLFVAFLLVLMVVTGVMVEHFEYPLVLSGILGIYLLACTYAAIGLFMSSLTNHQMVAAIGTIALLAALAAIGTVGQRIPMVADIAYWLSIDGRVAYMRTGLIASKDVLYFLSIIAMFLAFTFLKLSAGRRIERAKVHALKYGGVFAATVLFGYVTSLPELTWYADTTRDDIRSLTPASVQAVDGLDGTLDMTVLVNVLDLEADRFLPARRNQMYRRLFEQHERQIGRINVDYQYYYADADNEPLYAANPGRTNEQLAREFAEQNRLDFDTFLSRQQAYERYGLERERYDNIFLFQWQGRSTFLGHFRDLKYHPGEPEISAAIKRLTDGPRTIGYVTGHGERRVFRRGGTDHRTIVADLAERGALVNQGFDVVELALDRPVAEEVDILVLAGPTQPWSDAALAHLLAYIAAGRDLLIMAEPDAQGVMHSIAGDLGITFADSRLTEPSEDFPEDLIFTGLTEAAGGIGFAMRPILAGYPVILPSAGVLRHDAGGPFAVTPLLGATGSDATLAVALERTVGGRSQRVVVVGDADFMSDATLNLPAPELTNNAEFLRDMFGYLSHGEYPIDTARPRPIDTHIAIQPRQVDYLKILLYGAIPAALLLSGGGLLLRRRRR